MIELIDAHCHLQDERLSKEAIPRLLDHARAVGVSTCIVNGCWPGDWERVVSLSQQYPTTILPQFGLHPWWVSKRTGDWLTALHHFLLTHPSAGLGECGLDKGPKGLAAAPWDDQIEAFRSQLMLAQQLNRPVTVHCVKAHGTVHDMLKELKITVPVVLHAYTGSADMTRTFMQMPNVYFSLGGHLTKRPPSKAIPMLQVLGSRRPQDRRFLLESDSPDGSIHLNDEWKEFMSKSNACHVTDTSLSKPDDINTPASVSLMLDILSIAIHSPREEIARSTTQLARKIYQDRL